MKMRYWKYRKNPNSNIANIAKAISVGSFFQSLTNPVNNDFHSSFAVMFMCWFAFYYSMGLAERDWPRPGIPVTRPMYHSLDFCQEVFRRNF